MEPGTLYSLAADAMLILHALFVVFVVGGLILVHLGRFLSWQWVRNPWFRLVHLFGIGVVVIQSWLGLVCPLTVWEMNLRSKSGGAVYEGTFISHWLTELLYYQASWWVFAICYTVFGILALSSWFLVRPRAFSAGARKEVS